MQKYFKYKYKYFWEKVYKILKYKILFMYLKQHFKYLYFKYSPTLSITIYSLLPPKSSTNR